MRKKYLSVLLFLVAISLALFFFMLPKNILADSNSSVIMKVKILVCGDELKEGWEQCDRGDLGGQSCVSLGYGGGVLSCDPACEFNTSACLPGPYCGDGSCHGSENCASCSADCGICPPASGGGGGGGGGGFIPAPTSVVNFSGHAYPYNKVTLLKDGQVVLTTVSGGDANFSFSLSGINSGYYNFSIFSEDVHGLKSDTLTFSINVTAGASTNVGGILLAPTIDLNRDVFNKGDNITIFGQSVPNTKITISVNSDQEHLLQAETRNDGVYSYDFDSSVLELGEHSAKSKTKLAQQLSSFSRVVNFQILAKGEPLPEDKEQNEENIGDFNDDEKVNLIDFSILAYWYKKASPPVMIDLNNDKVINLIDFSILAYYWTG